MTWTIQEIENLEKSLKEGARKVKYQDREVEYRSLSELQRTIDAARRELGLIPRGRRFSVSSSSKGLS